MLAAAIVSFAGTSRAVSLSAALKVSFPLATVVVLLSSSSLLTSLDVKPEIIVARSVNRDWMVFVSFSSSKLGLFRIFVGQERKEKKVARVIEKE